MYDDMDIRAGKTLSSQPYFYVIFFLVGLIALAGVATLVAATISGSAIWVWTLVGAMGIGGAITMATKFGQTLMIFLVLTVATIMAGMSIAAAAMSWMGLAH